MDAAGIDMQVLSLNSPGIEQADVAEQVAIALGLVRLCDTHVVYRQDTSDLTTVRERLRLTEEECRHIDNLQQGQALWRITNSRRFLVEHQLSASEEDLVNTNARMAQSA